MPYKDRSKYLSSQRNYYHKDKDSYKWRNIKNTFGLSREDFFNILEKQDNKCALCNKPFGDFSSRILHIDHDHETNKVRGLLCMPCNVGLGMLGDNEEGLSKALKYVKGELS